jgi:hypothetical protein
MANPTSNFGWQMPTPVDLVTDLPADFEVFGQAVDSSLADLKGGTSGQVLSKNSNTDMDFVWVTSDDANAIQNAIVNAKGDIIGASANDTPAITSVGANGEMLVADSSTATGLDWKTATEQYPWQSYTPTRNAITVGNGTEIARYQQIGKTVIVQYYLLFGSTTSFGNDPAISPPLTPANTNNIAGTVMYSDPGVSPFLGQFDYFSGTNLMYFVVGNAAATYLGSSYLNASIPFTWAANDFVRLTATYEVA